MSEVKSGDLYFQNKWVEETDPLNQHEAGSLVRAWNMNGSGTKVKWCHISMTFSPTNFVWEENRSDMRTSTDEEFDGIFTKVTMEMVLSMVHDVLMQSGDGEPLDDITVNPDMDRFDDIPATCVLSMLRHLIGFYGKDNLIA